MFKVEEKTNGIRRSVIFMRQDGSFEGRIYGLESGSTSESAASSEPFKMCGVTETLRPLEEIVDEELYR